MLTITSSTGHLTDSPKEFCRLILTEEPPNHHRFVEKSDGTLEYRLGAGKWSEVDARALRILVRTIVQTAKSHLIEKIAVELPQARFPKLSTEPVAWYTSTIVENVLLAAYEYTAYKTKTDDKKKGLKELMLCGMEGREAAAGVARGRTVAEFMNKARDIANTPGRDLLPNDLAEEAKKLLKHKSIKVTVLGEKELRKLKMGALLAVGAGTKSETKFIIAEYWGAGKPSGKKAGDKAPIVLIGKGITYDTGGLNVKPAGAMHDMHLDMSGGSSVLAALGAAATLGIKKNIVALVPAAENAISDDAMRAGDILTSMSGQTIEVMHTDAEGRLILADALTYSERYTPRAIIDVATLTGAALVALGQHASAIMTKDNTLRTTLSELGERSGDYVWPLPLWDEYKQHIKSSRADVANVAPNFSRWGGAIEGGTFLSHFAPKDVPWAHIDIAPRMDSIAGDKLAKGSTGEPVRLLVAFIEQY